MVGLVIERLRVQGQGSFICHMINYTGYNQKLNVDQIRSAQWTVQRIKDIGCKIKVRVSGWQEL